MPYNLSYVEDDGIVFTEYLPPLSQADYAEIVPANLAMAAETGALLFLGDCRALPPGGSVFDVYALGVAERRALTRPRPPRVDCIPQPNSGL
jgi:hypothetical protein